MVSSKRHFELGSANLTHGHTMVRDPNRSLQIYRWFGDGIVVKNIFRENYTGCFNSSYKLEKKILKLLPILNFKECQFLKWEKFQVLILRRTCFYEK